MSFAPAFLMPLTLLLPAAGPIEAMDDISGVPVCSRSDPVNTSSMQFMSERSFEVAPVALRGWPFQFAVQSFQPATAHQVRIEQRMTIRISPRPSPVRSNMLMDLPQHEMARRFEERRIGKCLSVSSISGVQPNGENKLILFTRDHRIVRAELERSCRARDFYSGFYLSTHSDGRLCVDRDTLQSRSGANCRLSRIRQLVEVSD